MDERNGFVLSNFFTCADGPKPQSNKHKVFFYLIRLIYQRRNEKRKMRLLLSCFAYTLASAATASAIKIDERAILKEFYEATGGHAWNENYGWAEDLADICDWHGVICNAEDLEDDTRRRIQEGDDAIEDGQVLGLKLNNNFVTGRTPSSLWDLPSLVFIDFSYNPHLDVNFVGLQQASGSPLRSVKVLDTATTSIVGLDGASDTLQTLNLSQNNLNSQIPADIYKLTQLLTLQISDGGLLGSIPNDIHRLSLLRSLNLYQNFLTGTLPDGLARLVHLRDLTLSFNQLRGTLPDYLQDFDLLQELWLSSNDFSGPVPSFSRCPELHKLYLNGNSFSGEIPQDFLDGTIYGPRENTIHVNLEHNEFSGGVPATLDFLQDLDMVWMLGDNEWTSMDVSLCDNQLWNEGSIASYECYGLLCPPGTFSRVGYQSDEVSCQPCVSADYWGSTNCYDKDDRSVLVEIYVALQGEKWDNNENWLDEDDFCTWYGVTCWDINDAKTGRVRKIELPNNNLKGVIPSTIYSMHHLTTIDFSRNEIVLPFDDIQQSQHMFSINIVATNTQDYDGIQYANDFFRRLYADQTPINGPLPSEILGLKSAYVISLQECGITGEIPEEIFEMESLEQLYLANNDLQGVIPDRWGELENLEILTLAKNQLQGPLPPSFDDAPSLRAISLQDQVTKGGGLTGAVHPLSSTTTIRTLFLADNKLDGDLPELLLNGLEGDDPVTVDLNNNLITGNVHGSYSRFRRMNLYLEGNLITAVDENLCDLDDWMSGAVRAFGCDAILCPAGTMGGRRRFTDMACQECSDASARVGDGTVASFYGQASCSKGSLDDMSERDILEVLFDQCGGNGWHARQNWKTDEPICEWYGIGCDETGSVTSIQLGGNQLVGSFPTELYMLPNLVHLKLYSNTIYFNFDGIENARNLKTLGLDNTGLDSIEGVGRARSLVELNLAWNKLSGPLPEELSRLINLHTFDVSHNEFDGFLPYWFQSLVSLSTFMGSNNKFSGPVYDFSSLGDLIYLDLSHNRLTGQIPPTLFNGADDDEKVVADLSNNKLSGTVPADLSRLSRLSLQLENNRISGVADELCEVEGFNDYDVQQFGCDGILCPAGTWNRLGRQSNEDSPCEPCSKAKYMGNTNCQSSSAASRMVRWWVAGVAAVVATMIL